MASSLPSLDNIDPLTPLDLLQSTGSSSSSIENEKKEPEHLSAQSIAAIEEESDVVKNFATISVDQILTAKEMKPKSVGSYEWLNKQLEKLTPAMRASRIWDIAETTGATYLHNSNHLLGVNRDFYHSEEFLRHALDKVKDLTLRQLKNDGHSNNNRQSIVLKRLSGIPSDMFEKEEFWLKNAEYVKENLPLFLNFVPQFNYVYRSLKTAKILQFFNASYEKTANQYPLELSLITNNYYEATGKRLPTVNLPPDLIKNKYNEHHAISLYTTRTKQEAIQEELGQQDFMAWVENFGIHHYTNYLSGIQRPPFSKPLYDLLKKYIFTPEVAEQRINEQPMYSVFYEEEGLFAQWSEEKKLNVYNQLFAAYDITRKITDTSTYRTYASQHQGAEEYHQDLIKSTTNYVDMCKTLNAPVEHPSFVLNLLRQNASEGGAYFSKTLMVYPYQDAQALLRKTIEEFVKEPSLDSKLFENSPSAVEHQTRTITQFFENISTQALDKNFPTQQVLKDFLLDYPYVATGILKAYDSQLREALSDTDFAKKIIQLNTNTIPLLGSVFLDNLKNDNELDQRLIAHISTTHLQMLAHTTNPAFFTQDNLIQSLTNIDSKKNHNHPGNVALLDKKLVSHITKQKSNLKSKVFFEQLLSDIEAVAINHKEAEAKLEADPAEKNKLKKSVAYQQYLLVASRLIIITESGLWDDVWENQSPSELKNLYTKYLDAISLYAKNSYQPQISFFPIRLLSDVPYCLEMCQKYKDFQFQEFLTEKLVYSRQFTSWLVDKAHEKAGNQKITHLKQHLPKKIIEFFEKAGVEDNCVDFIHTYFEKKDLHAALSTSATRWVQINAQDDDLYYSARRKKHSVSTQALRSQAQVVLLPENFTPIAPPEIKISKTGKATKLSKKSQNPSSTLEGSAAQMVEIPQTLDTMTVEAPLKKSKFKI